MISNIKKKRNRGRSTNSWYDVPDFLLGLSTSEYNVFQVLSAAVFTALRLLSEIE